jgi:DNA-binding beta-propeller fold protein YncE
VADSGNFRILRYDPPFTNGMNAVQVFGQLGSFTTANQAAQNAATADNLGNPDGIAVDIAGNLYCADRFLHRLVRYNSPVATDTTADLVIGQINFTTANGNQGGNPAANTLLMPIGCGLDADSNLYIADEGNNRVLFYPAPLVNNQAATRVFGQPSFTTGGINQGGLSASSMNGPVSVAVDPVTGNLYVADAINNRILEFVNPQTDNTADRVFGQNGSFTTGIVNNGGISANSLNDVGGVATDAAGNLYAGDRLNNRVLRYSINAGLNLPPGGGLIPCGPCGPGMGAMMPLALVGWLTIRLARRRRSL